MLCCRRTIVRCAFRRIATFTTPPARSMLAPCLTASASAHDTPAYLASLNAQQRDAVEHGVGSAATAGGPLLIIAGAGSGKTSTLACRAAHLIAHGADPQRMLLLTFSRRAAEELERRAAPYGRARSTASLPACCGNTRSASASTRRSAFSIARTPRIFSTSSVTISDSRARRPAFRRRARASPSTRASSTASRRSTRFSRTLIRGARSGAARSRNCSRRTSASSRRRTSSITTTSCSIGRACWRSRRSRATSASVSTTCWSTNIRTPIGSSRRSCWR